jgi:hypothetical protein
MLLAYRLVKLIETHSDGLARTLQQKIESTARCSAYQKLPAGELTKVVGEMYHGMGQWLLGKSEEDIERRYTRIGQRRAEQGIPLSQVIWTIALVKENLWEYVKTNNLGTPVELFGELEILQLLDQFFDRAMYYAVHGYEGHGHAREVLPATETTSTRG